jgi:hypothetical protein
MKKIVLLFSLAVMCLGVQAQKQVLDNVLKAAPRGTGAIIKDNNTTGYYSFYQLDKKDKKTRNYQLNIYDQNLSPLSTKKFSSQEDLIALEAAYNGELILIKFFDDKADKYLFKSFDQNAQQVSSRSTDAKKVYNQIETMTNSEEGENHTLTPVEGAGFVHFVTKFRGGKLSHTYNEVTFLPNNKDAKGWTWTTPEKSEDFEWGDVLGSNGKVVLCLVNRRGKLMSRDIEDFILGIDVATGKKIFENPLEDKKYAISVGSAMADLDGNFQLFGSYFDKDAKTAKAKSFGLFGFSVDAAGKVLTRKYESWEKDVSKFLKVSSKGKIADVGYLYFHKFIKTADNKIFGIAEQYKPNVGASIALSILARQTATDVKIEDLYVFEFDQTFDLKNVTVFDKTPSTVVFPGIVGSSRVLGMYLQYIGEFEYAFTQMSKDKSKFSVGYVDYDKTKGQKGYYFGSINYTDGKLTTDKMKFDKKAEWQHVYPGKPGYVMITEYFKKEKKLEFRMEKLNF